MASKKSYYEYTNKLLDEEFEKLTSENYKSNLENKIENFYNKIKKIQSANTKIIVDNWIDRIISKVIL